MRTLRPVDGLALVVPLAGLPLPARRTSATPPTTPLRNTYVRKTVALAYAASELHTTSDPMTITADLRDRRLIIECAAGGLRLAKAA